MTEWKPYLDPYRRFDRNADYPHNHDWIELKRYGEASGIVIRPGDLHPAMNAAYLLWRPATPAPQSDMPSGNC